MSDEHSKKACDDRPRSVDELAFDPQWRITRSSRSRRWVTAEYRATDPEDPWVIGLTPIAHDLVAAILWKGDIVTEHERGSETAMCELARRWIARLGEQSFGPA
ncbi:hypothetical protein GCM10027598_47530 [Amycolatopsis oliviviridis]|uniref:Uncharacterized protein n=1 Tax=Amycolatopsis oliviviridis TaxID=1471590 RepID=A0ABQ3MAC6_9PSEU|nr:hypothetical protein [Amycolatopsis oliviviridis]GHH37705.1 hypothetical protein GCM10017790_82380 [Amycolatopsis oliviviridis]